MTLSVHTVPVTDHIEALTAHKAHATAHRDDSTVRIGVSNRAHLHLTRHDLTFSGSATRSYAYRNLRISYLPVTNLFAQHVIDLSFFYT